MTLLAGVEFASQGDGIEPIICLHGIGGNTESFRPQLDGLSKHTCVIAWNMPGYGQSDLLTPTTFAALADKLKEFMDAAGIPRAHIMGQSIGGMIALEFAVTYPERALSLALIATTAAFGGADDSFKEQFLAARLLPLDQGATMPQLAQRFVPDIVGPVASTEAINSAIASMSAVPVASYREILKCLVTFNRRDDLHLLRLPCCLIAGQADKNAPPRTMARMAEKMPDALYHEIAGAGHLVNLEASVETIEILSTFYKFGGKS